MRHEMVRTQPFFEAIRLCSAQVDGTVVGLQAQQLLLFARRLALSSVKNITKCLNTEVVIFLTGMLKARLCPVARTEPYEVCSNSDFLVMRHEESMQYVTPPNQTNLTLHAFRVPLRDRDRGTLCDCWSLHRCVRCHEQHLGGCQRGCTAS